MRDLSNELLPHSILVLKLVDQDAVVSVLEDYRVDELPRKLYHRQVHLQVYLFALVIQNP